MPARPLRLLVGVVAAGLLAGCSGGAGTARDEPAAGSSTGSSTGSPTGSSGSGSGSGSVLGGLDVCRLPSAAMVRTASEQDALPTTRSFAPIAGYDGLVDQCGFGPSFASSAFVVAVGFDPAGPKVLAGLPGAGRPVEGVGDGARATEDPTQATVTFVRGRTLVQLRAARPAGGASALARLTEVAAELAGRVPPTPPAGDAQTLGRCADVDQRLVAGLLGAPAVVSRSLAYRDRSATCAWATGTRRPATVTLSLYTNPQAGPFLAALGDTGPNEKVTGVPGNAFTLPGRAYVVAEDGQAAALRGQLPSAPDPRKPLPVTPELTALLEDAASLLQ